MKDLWIDANFDKLFFVYPTEIKMYQDSENMSECNRQRCIVRKRVWKCTMLNKRVDRLKSEKNG